MTTPPQSDLSTRVSISSVTNERLLEPTSSLSTSTSEEIIPVTFITKDLPPSVWNISSTASLGNVLVIGAGRPLGSALVAALYASGVAVWAIEDGTKGFISSVHYDVPAFEFNISIAFDSLNDVWQRRAPDTVFVDGLHLHQ